MTVNIASGRNGFAKVVLGNPKNLSSEDLSEILGHLGRHADYLQRQLADTDRSGACLANIYEDAKIIGELASALRKFCHQREMGGL